jgi:hypothetical protein
MAAEATVVAARAMVDAIVVFMLSPQVVKGKILVIEAHCAVSEKRTFRAISAPKPQTFVSL